MKNFLLGYFFLYSISFLAQTSDVGGPVSWSFNQDLDVMHIPHFQLSKSNIDKQIKINDSIELWTKRGFIFGVEQQVDIDFHQNAYWQQTKKGRIGRLEIRSSEAISLNLIFDQYNLSDRSFLYLYSSDKKELLGAYTSENNNKQNILGTDLIHHEEIIVELFEPSDEVGKSILHISNVVHGYKDIDNALGLKVNESGACNMDVICSDGLPWANEIKSVVRILSGGTLCTGTLVNNTAQDGTPYVLTAEHCNPQNMGNAVFRFNYDSPICGSQTVANSQAPSGSPQTINGSSFIASKQDSDFGLVELNSVPPASYDVFYAGWRNTSAVSSTAVCIHHPSGDVKKISFDDDPLQNSSQNGVSNNMWEVETWERSTTTEQGSSGSALWDQDHYIVGTLFGGPAACGNSLSDFYGKFSMSWTGNNSAAPNQRLSNWLDPTNSGLTQLSGYSPGTPALALDGTISDVNLSSEVFCSAYIPVEFTIMNNGSSNLTSAEIEILVDGVVKEQYQWTGSLSYNGLQAVSLSNSLEVYSSGNHSVEVRITSVNNQQDQNSANNSYSKSFSNYPGSSRLNLNLDLDCWGSEISWQITDNDNTVIWEVLENTYPDVQPAGTTVNEVVCLENGCYDFTINDTYGDGMYGSQYTECSVNGNFTMVDQWNSNTFFSMTAPNANFGVSETHSFCVTSNSVASNNYKDLIIFPNPSEGTFRIKTEGLNQKLGIQILDVSGKIIKSFSAIPNGDYSLDVLNKGFYIIKVKSNNNVLGSYNWIKSK